MSDQEVIIIGAGPAGLSVGACLRRQGVDSLILERADSVGSSWRGHYDRLHLHTVKQLSALPHHPWPRAVPTYPSRAQVVEYLESYAEAHPQPIRFGEEVRRVRRRGGRFQVQTDAGEHRADKLVVATGYNRRPHLPQWPGQDGFAGTIVHSCRYHSGAPWKGRRALVVGSGNSGAEIALDLWEHGASVDLCVRGAVHIMPRDPFGTPAQVTGLLMAPLPPALADRIALAMLDRVVGDLSHLGLKRPKLGPAARMRATGRVPFIDVGTLALIREGHVSVRPGIERFSNDGVQFVDGEQRAYDLVLLATGYRAAIEDFLEGAERLLDERGYPKHIGEESELPGLYFVGYKNRPVGLLHDIATDARAVADAIAAETSPHRKRDEPRWRSLITGIRSRLTKS